MKVVVNFCTRKVLGEENGEAKEKLETAGKKKRRSTRVENREGRGGLEELWKG